VPSPRTELTEVLTGLGTLGYDGLDRALLRRPDELVDVGPDVWHRLQRIADDRQHRALAHAAFTNGGVLLRSTDGLRGRPPRLIEWKGGHRAPGASPVPVDLRLDHVYLVSCKYASRILLNAAPATLFANRPDTGDWYDEVAPAPYQALYAAVRPHVGGDLPPFASDLARHHRAQLKERLAEWPDAAAAAAYAELSAEVGRESARRWRDSLRSRGRQEAMLWRLLRIVDAPYFVLGVSGEAVLRVRVTTPWDWRRRFDFRSLEMWGAEAGQPKVGWRATVRDHEAGEDRSVEGHVEIRWSHGRFAQVPEAKVYLDTPHHRVPGYVPLA
jgi:hypothetical protein